MLIPPAYNPDTLPPSKLARKGGDYYMTQILVDRNESFEAALKRFNKKVQEDRILSEVRRRRFFEPKSVERKKRKAAKKRKSLKETLRSEDRD